MNQLVKDVLGLDDRRQAALRTVLAQQVLPILRSSVDFEYATRAIDLCWGWIERRGVTGMALYELNHNDDDIGVSPAMSIEHDPVLWAAWYCVVEAVVYTGYCAFTAEDPPPPDNFMYDFPEDYLTKYLGHYHDVIGQMRLPQELVGILNHLSDTQLTREVVSAALEELLSLTT